MTQISCRGCRGWFDAIRMSCPDCDWVRPGYNSYLERVRLDNHLYQQLEDSKPRNQYERDYKRYKADIDRIAQDL